MRTRWLLLALLGLSFGIAGVTDRPASAEDADQINKLIKQLGSSKFTERDKAKRELEAIGEAALDALRKAVKSGDLETSRRAAELVQKMEGKITRDNLLAPKKLHLKLKDTPVPEAVAQLAKLSGYTIEILGDRAALAKKTVTLDTGETTFWQAFDQLCQKAGLVETSAAFNPYNPQPVPLPPGKMRPPIRIQPLPAPALPVVPPGQPQPAPNIQVQPGAIQIQIDVPNIGAVPVRIEAPAVKPAPDQPAPAKKADAPARRAQAAGQAQAAPAQAKPAQAPPADQPVQAQPLPAVRPVQVQVAPAPAQPPVQIQPAPPVQVLPVQPGVRPINPGQPVKPAQIYLTEGKPREVPTHYAGAIRVRVLTLPQANPQQPAVQPGGPVPLPGGPAPFPGGGVQPVPPNGFPGGAVPPGFVPPRVEGEAIILLQVSAEPRLQNFHVTGNVQVDR